jgi:hypothetical protein
MTLWQAGVLDSILHNKYTGFAKHEEIAHKPIAPEREKKLINIPRPEGQGIKPLSTNKKNDIKSGLKETKFQPGVLGGGGGYNFFCCQLGDTPVPINSKF